MKEYEDGNVLNNFIKERLEENKELFTCDEISKLNKEFELIKKIYLLGFINAKF